MLTWKVRKWHLLPATWNFSTETTWDTFETSGKQSNSILNERLVTSCLHQWKLAMQKHVPLLTSAKCIKMHCDCPWSWSAHRIYYTVWWIRMLKVTRSCKWTTFGRTPLTTIGLMRPDVTNTMCNFWKYIASPNQNSTPTPKGLETCLWGLGVAKYRHTLSLYIYILI